MCSCEITGRSAANQRRGAWRRIEDVLAAKKPAKDGFSALLNEIVAGSSALRMTHP
jgi:hypothetical protein